MVAVRKHSSKVFWLLGDQFRGGELGLRDHSIGDGHCVQHWREGRFFRSKWFDFVDRSLEQRFSTRDLPGHIWPRPETVSVVITGVALASSWVEVRAAKRCAVRRTGQPPSPKNHQAPMSTLRRLRNPALEWETVPQVVLLEDYPLRSFTLLCSYWIKNLLMVTWCFMWTFFVVVPERLTSKQTLR